MTIAKRPGREIVRRAHTCKGEVALIAPYLSGSLEVPLLKAFEAHLVRCPDCTAFLKTYRKTMELTASFLRMIPHPAPLPFTLSSKVMSLFVALYCGYGCIFLPPTSV